MAGAAKRLETAFFILYGHDESRMTGAIVRSGEPSDQFILRLQLRQPGVQEQKRTETDHALLIFAISRIFRMAREAHMQSQSWQMILAIRSTA